MYQTRATAVSPCPGGRDLDFVGDNTLGDFTTANLEYTTAFKASFKNVRPKRPQASLPPARRPENKFTIHEDEAITDPVPTLRPSLQTVTVSRKLSRPAKRVQLYARAPAKSSEFADRDRDRENISAHGLSRASRIASQHGASDPRPLEVGAAGARRPNRRRDIYIAPDDTTQPTMWMDIFSPIKKDQIDTTVFELSTKVEQLTVKPPQEPRMQQNATRVDARPKRGPLQMSQLSQKKSGQDLVHAGAPTGKENVPPHHQFNLASDAGGEKVVDNKSTAKDFDRQRRSFLKAARLKHSIESKSSAQKDIATMYEIGKKEPEKKSCVAKSIASDSQPQIATKTYRSITRPSLVQTADSVPNWHSTPSQPSRFARLSLRASNHVYQQIPLSEDIECSELYEDNWLSHQEAVTKQLINDLFMNSRLQRTLGRTADDQRKTLLQVYNTEEVVQLRKKLHNALSYGSLSLTHESMLHMQSLPDDVGRKKDFIKFWIDTFDTSILICALEVTTGKLLCPNKSGNSPRVGPSNRYKRSEVVKFIQAFLVRHEDAGFKAAGTGKIHDLGTKTILKSLMLLKALDLFKEHQISVNCLFQKSSPYKSSRQAVIALMRMLNPGAGDSIRLLRHLDYELSHEQEPLDELEYHVDNLATDMRDGVLLMHLTEILIYPSLLTGTIDSTASVKNTDMDASGTDLTASDMHPLCKKLHLPCVSRATQLHNVQLALSALRNIQTIGQALSDLTPADIVDGHREKTITLLSTLVSQYGLSHMLRATDIRTEIRRLTHGESSLSREVDILGDDPLNQIGIERLLRIWAKSCASRQQIEVENLSTSFSDGRAFNAILDEYEPFLVTNATKGDTLSQRLQRLGCSKQFSSVFGVTAGQAQIFSKNFVVAALAFLFSRVVVPSRQCRSAVTIQRCWRWYWQRVEIARRELKKDLAHACAASVAHKSMDAVLSAEAFDSASGQPGDTTNADEDIWLVV